MPAIPLTVNAPPKMTKTEITQSGIFYVLPPRCAVVILNMLSDTATATEHHSINHTVPRNAGTTSDTSARVEHPCRSEYGHNGLVPETFDPGKVDLVSIPKSGSVVDLHIVQDNAWIGSDDQLTTLQQKINNYVSFAVDGALLANYPETAGLPWRIVIVSREGQPDPRTSFVLDQITSAVRQYGGELVV
jgi:hypothetical protein